MRSIIITFLLTVIQVGLSLSQHLQKSPDKEDFKVQSRAVAVMIPWLENQDRANQWVSLTGWITNFYQRGGTEEQRRTHRWPQGLQNVVFPATARVSLASNNVNQHMQPIWPNVEGCSAWEQMRKGRRYLSERRKPQPSRSEACSQ